MIKKIILAIVLSVSAAIAFMGQSHSDIISNVPEHLIRLGFNKEGSILNNHMDILKVGVESPDLDYPGLKVPEDLVPPWLKPITSTSVAKWEHTLVDDIPKEIEVMFKKLALRFHIKFRYADETIVDWIGIAQEHWRQGDTYNAMRHLARACHLIQDICVPMHCKVRGNVMDVWNVLNCEHPNHEKFERHCIKMYQPVTSKIDLDDNFKLPDITYKIAKKSRKQLKYCDGFGPGGIFNVIPFRYIFPCLVEDYDKAAETATRRAEKYTVMLVHYFFQSVGVK